MDIELANVFSLDGRVAVVTGAGSGIGAEVGRVLHAAGAHVVLADRDADGVADLSEALGDRASAVPTDVTDRAAVLALADAAEELGPLDAWVNTAGIIVARSPIVETDPAALERVLEVNLKGAYWCAAEAGRRLSARGRGSIVTISSYAGDAPVPGAAPYGISKAGVNMLTRILATELGPSGVRVNGVAPGFIDTPMVSYQFRTPGGDIDPARRESYFASMAATAALQRTGTPRDIALAVLYLVSDASAFMTGQTLRPNGGTSML